jgi:hypothetical protein
MLNEPWLCVVVLAEVLLLSSATAATWPAELPVYDHIVIVIEENKDYEQIILNKDAAFINQLAVEGALFTKMFSEEHNSEEIIFGYFPAPIRESTSTIKYQRKS